MRKKKITELFCLKDYPKITEVGGKYFYYQNLENFAG